MRTLLPVAAAVLLTLPASSPAADGALSRLASVQGSGAKGVAKVGLGVAAGIRVVVSTPRTMRGRTTAVLSRSACGAASDPVATVRGRQFGRGGLFDMTGAQVGATMTDGTAKSLRVSAGAREVACGPLEHYDAAVEDHVDMIGVAVMTGQGAEARSGVAIVRKAPAGLSLDTTLAARPRGTARAATFQQITWQFAGVAGRKVVDCEGFAFMQCRATLAAPARLLARATGIVIRGDGKAIATGRLRRFVPAG